MSPSPAAAAGALGSSLPILDGIIVIVLLIALYIGYQRGIIQPLMTYLFFFGAIFLMYRERVPYLNGVQKYLHANVVLAIFFALIIAVLNVAIAIAVIYFVLSGLIVFDKAFTPFANNAKLTQAQVSTMSKQIESNPLAAALVDPKDLQKLKDETKKGQATTLSTVTQLDNLSTFYQDFIRPQLQTSRIAPYIMRIGQKIPVLGHFGASDLPKK